MKKKLAVGSENFPNMIRNHCYYVDKTGFIRTVMESESRVLLVTRPRRFGKTLFIDTVKSFLQIDFVNPGAATKFGIRSARTSNCGFQKKMLTS